MGVREHDLQTLGGIFHFVDVGANAFVQAKTFSGDHVFAQHRAFGFQVQADSGLHAVHCLQNATDNLANLAAEKLKLLVLLSIADFLLNCLSCARRGIAAKIGRGGFHHDKIANLGVGIDLARFIQ